MKNFRVQLLSLMCLFSMCMSAGEAQNVLTRTREASSVIMPAEARSVMKSKHSSPESVRLEQMASRKLSKFDAKVLQQSALSKKSAGSLRERFSGAERRQVRRTHNVVAGTNSITINQVAYYYFSSSLDVYYQLISEESGMFFTVDIFLPEGQEDVTLGQTYTLADMDTTYTNIYEYDEDSNEYQVVATPIAATFVKNISEETGLESVTSTMVTASGDVYILMYSESYPDATRTEDIVMSCDLYDVTLTSGFWRMANFNSDESRFVALTGIAQALAGTYTLKDSLFNNNDYTFVAESDGEGGYRFYDVVRANVMISDQTDGVVTITGTLLCQNVDDETDVPEYSITISAKTFTNCATVNAAPANTYIRLKDVTVVFAKGGNIFVTDDVATTHIYSTSYQTVLNAGDTIAEVEGITQLYYTLPELIPSTGVSDLQITSGDAPEIPDATAAPTSADVNKVMMFRNVDMGSQQFTTTRANRTGTFMGEQVAFRNNWQEAFTFEQGKLYDMLGCVALYNGAVQVYVTNFAESPSVVPEYTDSVEMLVERAELIDVISIFGAYQIRGWETTTHNYVSVAVYASEIAGTFTNSDMYNGYNQVNAYNTDSGKYVTYDTDYLIEAITVQTEVGYRMDARFIANGVLYKVTFDYDETVRARMDNDRWGEDATQSYTDNDVITMEIDYLESYGYIDVSMVASDTYKAVLRFYPSAYDNVTILPVGTYLIDDSGAAGTVGACPSSDGTIYPSYFVNIYYSADDDTYYFNKAWCIVSGTVTVSYVNGMLSIVVDAYNTWDRHIVITYMGDPSLYTIKHTLSLSAADATMGYCRGAGEYSQGADVTFEAVPYDGYVFTHWSDGSLDMERTVTMNEDIELVAYFGEVISSNDADASLRSLLVQQQPNGALPLVVAVPSNPDALVEVLQANEVTMSAEITVYAADGETVRTLVVYFERSDVAVGVWNIAGVGSQGLYDVLGRPAQPNMQHQVVVGKGVKTMQVR